MFTVDVSRYADEILDYIRLHLGVVYGNRLDDGYHYIESGKYEPDQILVYETILSFAMSVEDTGHLIDRGVTKVYQALYSKYPEVGIYGITVMFEEVVASEAFIGLKQTFDLLRKQLRIPKSSEMLFKMHRELTTLVVTT